MRQLGILKLPINEFRWILAKLVENGGASLQPIGGTDPYPANVRHVFEVTMQVDDDLVITVTDNYFPYVNEGKSFLKFWKLQF